VRIPVGQGLVLSETAIAFLVFSLTGFSIAAIMVLPMPILSDVIDLDELRTGERREAMYFGAQGFLQKLGAGLSGIIMTQLFSRFGYSREQHLGVDLLGPVGGFLVLIGFAIFMFYPLTEAKAAEIRAQLEVKRKG